MTSNYCGGLKKRIEPHPSRKFFNKALSIASMHCRAWGIHDPTGAGYSMDMELIFEVRDAEEGGYYARALGHAIFT